MFFFFVLLWFICKCLVHLVSMQWKELLNFLTHLVWVNAFLFFQWFTHVCRVWKLELKSSCPHVEIDFSYWRCHFAADTRTCQWRLVGGSHWVNRASLYESGALFLLKPTFTGVRFVLLQFCSFRNLFFCLLHIYFDSASVHDKDWRLLDTHYENWWFKVIFLRYA